MFNKKLISTVLSALTLFPTASPLVSANGSQASEQLQPSATAPSSAPDATDTGIVPPAPKRLRQAESQEDAPATPDSKSAPTPECIHSPLSDSSSNISPHTAAFATSLSAPENSVGAPVKRMHRESSTPSLLKIRRTHPSAQPFIQRTHTVLNLIDNLTDRFHNKSEFLFDYISSDIISLNDHSQFMSFLYASLGVLIIILDAASRNPTIDYINLQNEVNTTLKNLHSEILNAFRRSINSCEFMHSDYLILKNSILNGRDLFDPDGRLPTLCDSIVLEQNLSTQINNTIAMVTHPMSNIHYDTVQKLYSYSLINITLQNIRKYFMTCRWRIDGPAKPCAESASEHLMDTLSSDLTSLYSTLLSNPSALYPDMFARIARTKNLLNLNILNRGFDIQPYVSAKCLTDLHNNFIPNIETFTSTYYPNVINHYLCSIYCYCPLKLHARAFLYTKLKNLNAEFFQKIEKINFEKFPESQKAFKSIFPNKESLFDLSQSPVDYYKNFTYEILKSPNITDSKVRIRLCKLSILANLLIYIQNDPCQYSLLLHFKNFINLLHADISKIFSTPAATLRGLNYSILRRFLAHSRLFDDLAEPVTCHEMLLPDSELLNS